MIFVSCYVHGFGTHDGGLLPFLSLLSLIFQFDFCKAKASYFVFENGNNHMHCFPFFVFDFIFSMILFLFFSIQYLGCRAFKGNGSGSSFGGCSTSCSTI